MQLVLVELLDTGLADMVRAAVIDRVELLELLLVDSPDIAHRVREMRTLRVMPDQLRRHLDARQAELIHGDAGNLLLGQLIHDWYRLERPAPLQYALLEQPALFLAELQHLDHRIEHGLPVAGALTGDGQAETGTVVGDDPALAVEDQAAIGRNRLHVNAVVLRQRRMVLELHHLQVIHPRYQHANQQQHDSKAHDDAPAHQHGVLLVVLELNRLRHLEGVRGLLVIGMTGQQRPGAVDLFADQDSHQRVRQGQRRQ